MAKKYEILDASEKIGFHTIYDAINDVIGTEYTVWRKATWPNTNGNGKFRLWFPQLAKLRNGELVSASYDCLNTISDDWNEMKFDDLKNSQADMTKKFWGYDLVFAKDAGGEYVFRGVFVRDKEKSTPNHDFSKRIATKVRLIGDPTYDIELLDEIMDSMREVVALDDTHTEEEKEIHAAKLSIDELYKIAIKQSVSSPKQITTTVTQTVRNPYISEYAKKRAKGICQLCGMPAPFTKSDGEPYLETHHIEWLSKGGEDSVENTVALCPNCHRRMHVLQEEADIQKLKATI